MSNNPQKNNPVGVFDSGVGGISVLLELRKQLPAEDFLYFGDCANAPYGRKSEKEIAVLAEHAVDLLLNKNVKAIVIACNTATAAAAAILRERHPELPIIGMEPAIKPACAVGTHPRVLVLATPATLSLDKFKNLEEQLSEQADFDLLPCPHFVDLVEQGKTDGSEATEYLINLLHQTQIPVPDAVVLGCTHFPFLRKAITSVFGENIPIFDGAKGTAKQLKARLSEEGLCKEGGTPGSVQLFCSAPEKHHIALMKRLLEGES